ncbi:hypothetical protein BDZ31_001986 [Conexibacter arvalis]|uniref:Uncharacterized protein n=1 Tax=Conexibacter arvalis TaxID=912552 RepID=A0A840IEP0_9ACTN|nr:hypothetical protein [Conexibacter arvalis]
MTAFGVAVRGARAGGWSGAPPPAARDRGAREDG